MPLCLKKSHGFTLIETALVIGLTAILATSATPVFIDVNRQAQLQAEQAVSSHVQTGISLNQMQNLGTTGVASFPPTLDNAPTGIIANGLQPFFNNVLSPAVTTGWRKVELNRYQSPTGTLYAYNPNDGTFIAQGQANPNSKDKNQQLGNKVFEYAGIVFYDSGAIVDTQSNLAYIPSLSEKTVALTLASGTKIDTLSDGSALITLANGQKLNVADIHKPNFFKLSPDSQKPDEFEHDYLWIQGGQASEGSQKIKYSKKEYESDHKGGKYHYEYEMDGAYAGGSLKTDFGYIYRTDYKTEKPQSSEGSWRKKENGDYEGSMKHTYKYDSESHYGYQHPEAKYRYAFKQDGKTSGASETNYTYDAKKEIYTHQTKGSHEYKIDSDTSRGKSKAEASYDYDGTSKYDKKNDKYESETRYQYKDGKDITYKYKYDGKSKEWEWESKDNKTGKVTKQTNKKKSDDDKDD